MASGQQKKSEGAGFMKISSANKLFTPIQVGPMELKHRVVMAPLTRSRSVQPGSIPGDLMLEYYSQRASNGGLIVSEGTSISIASGGWFGAPGLYSDEQVAGWKRVTNAVHGKRGHMFSQLWHTTCTLKWRVLRKWHGSRVVFEHHYDQQQIGGPLTFNDLSFNSANPVASVRRPS